MMTNDNSLSHGTPPHIKDGRYRPVAILGVGTYGRVLECVDSQNNNSPVAVKIARAEPAYRRCAIKECQVLSCLSGCEDVMDIHDSFEQDGHVCIVGEVLHKNMYEVLKDRAFVPIELESVRQVARVVLRALKSLHLSGYMHCDIKPENIMLRNSSGDFAQTCMIDFGAARRFSENAYFDIQSLWYRAPEVICGLPYTPLIDSWSVGCLLYELHTGAPLFPGDSAQSQLSIIIDMCGLPSIDAMTRGVNAPGLSFRSRPANARWETQIRGEQLVAEQFVDLLTQLLQPDETRRLSCVDALHHPFIASGGADQANSSISSAGGVSFSAAASMNSPNGLPNSVSGSHGSSSNLNGSFHSLGATPPSINVGIAQQQQQQQSGAPVFHVPPMPVGEE